VTHAAAVFDGLVRSKRARLGFLVLSMLAFVAIFAELIAGPAPVFAAGPSGVHVLPSITRASTYEGLTRPDIDAFHEKDVAIWPLVRYGPTTPAFAGVNAPCSREHPLGTDAQGHDLTARLVYGARTALGLSLGAVLLSLLLGTALGGLAGYDRGFWNDRLTRLVETVDTFPAIIVVALVRAIEREPSAFSLVLAVAIVRWAEVARLIRVEVLRADNEDYVMAARALGASPIRLFWRHVLPNAIGPMLVSSTFGIASVVLLESTISFLQMGVPTQVATWGETLAQGAANPDRLRLVLLPGFALLLTLGGSYLLSAAMRDAVDPRTLRAPRAPGDIPLGSTRVEPG
jgi:peptide/nickel transport system permease protein